MPRHTSRQRHRFRKPSSATVSFAEADGIASAGHVMAEDGLIRCASGSYPHRLSLAVMPLGPVVADRVALRSAYQCRDCATEFLFLR
jgi:hypothetical protein